MTVYFDTSAILKLALYERETDRLRQFLGGLLDSGLSPATSWLGETEFHRGAMRKGVGPGPSAEILADFDVYDVPKETFESASRLPVRELRTLDALHIAIALRARAESFVTYDQRQGEAAASLGLRVVIP
ncbi:MAG: type II toxin-antitoxin system VapC family toxin [Thermoleophilaceae bacterium]|nr:type II toxin-antitoxin system VapC family toxin [Thermoleophilaceae bacterium]